MVFFIIKKSERCQEKAGFGKRGHKGRAMYFSPGMGWTLESERIEGV